MKRMHTDAKWLSSKACIRLLLVLVQLVKNKLKSDLSQATSQIGLFMVAADYIAIAPEYSVFSYDKLVVLTMQNIKPKKYDVYLSRMLIVRAF